MVESNSRLKPWTPKVHVFPCVLDNEATLTPSIINHTGQPQVSLSHDTSGSPWRWSTFKGPHNLFSFTNHCGSSYCFTPTWGDKHGQRVIVDASVQLCSMGEELVTSRRVWPPREKKAWRALPGNTQNLMLLGSLKVGQLSVTLYVPFMAACSVLLLHMCFFIGVVSWKILLRVLALKPLSKWSQFNSSILK